MIKLKHLVVLGLSTVTLSACTLSDSFNSFFSRSTPTAEPTSEPTLAPSPTMAIIPTSSTSSAKITGTPSADSLVNIKTKDGTITFRLYKNETPKTVANFVSKVQSGFYKGLTFHRVIPGFMAQGGDPSGNGTGGGKQPSELNNIPFVRGTIGLARTAETKMVSNDSQFFICFTTQGCQHLTGEYVNFGEVISGLDVLDKIAAGDKIVDITLGK